MATFYSKNYTAYNQILGGSTRDDNYIFTLNNFGTYTINFSSRANSLDLSALTSSLIANLTSTIGHEVSDGAGNYINWLNNTILHITSGSGNDNILGNSANNIINSGAGNDSIYADAGNDNLIGGSGNDLLDGGAGNDIYIFTSGFGSDTILDSSGIDTINFSALNTALIIDLNSNASDGTNSINWSGNIIENVIAGLSDDVLAGNSSNNILVGGGGNDAIEGGLGNDLLDGGLGHDTYVFSGNWGLDTIRDASGTDTLDLSAILANTIIKLNSSYLVISGTNKVSANTANIIENVIAGAGNDTITGTNGVNLIYAGDGNNIIEALGGNDTLISGTGNDILNGGAGNDTYVFYDNLGINIISDTSGIDTIDLGNSTASYTINLASTANYEITDGTNGVNWSGSVIENIISGSGNDTINGNILSNRLEGGSGNDTIVDFDGNDFMAHAKMVYGLVPMVVCIGNKFLPQKFL